MSTGSRAKVERESQRGKIKDRNQTHNCENASNRGGDKFRKVQCLKIKSIKEIRSLSRVIYLLPYLPYLLSVFSITESVVRMVVRIVEGQTHAGHSVQTVSGAAVSLSQ